MTAVHFVRARLKQMGLTQYDVYQYLVYPIKAQIQYAFQHRFMAQKAPTIVTDLPTLAVARKWSFTTRYAKQIQQREPSKTIAEDSLAVVKHGPRLIKERATRPHSWVGHLRRLTTETERRAEMYYSQLYAVTRYPIQETFICEVPQATIMAPSGLVITAQFEVLTQSVYGQIAKEQLLQVKRNLVQQQPLSGSYVPLVTAYAHNYAHWLMDCLPRLDLVNLADSQLKFFIPANPKQYQLDSLALLGIDAIRLVELEQPSVVDRLLLCHAAQNAGVPSAKHLISIRERLLKATRADFSGAQPNRRLYVSRAKSRRAIVNEEELLPILKNYGFETVFCEELTFAEQIRLFSEANIVLGAHGAGMHNCLFCQPGAVVIEVFNQHRWDHTVSRMASLIGHQHWHIYGKNKGKTWDTYLDPQKLHKILMYALDNPISNTVIFYENRY